MAEIGKNIIENLTTGMYENSYTVYREYIQNAADSIDNAITSGLLKKYEAFIDIDINMIAIVEVILTLLISSQYFLKSWREKNVRALSPDV